MPEDHSYFQVRLPVHPEARKIDAVDTGPQVTASVTEQVTEQVQRLITAIGSREASTREIMEMMGLQHRPTFLYDFLQPAINMGFVAMTQPDKPRSSKQRYRVTEKGRMWLAGQHKES